ncbi:MAG TPA: hypothetical protein VKX17_26230 [Planctomycetota bacterium]|nr:hypothetical protein [Planctomycetota bacterium]
MCHCLLWVVAVFAIVFAGALAPVARAAESVNPYNTNPHSTPLIQPGACYEGDGEIWTPTPQNARKSDVVKWHWKLTVKKVDGEKFTGNIEWVHNGTTHEKVEGTFINGNTLALKFSGADKGGSAAGTIDNQGNVKFNYALPSADRIGEFTGGRAAK